tara:strand:- start:2778 stop:2894 length:117 start_codon:yes stop_codon:yes gene_type:complete
MDDTPDRLDETIHNINFEAASEHDWDQYISELFDREEP